MIYKDKNTALWCECGNKEHLLGFYKLKDETEYKFSDTWVCLKCKETISSKDIELRTEPEVKV